MSIAQSLYNGETIRLGPIDHERDAETVSRWTHDPEYLRGLGPKLARPRAPEQVKKDHEAIEKQVDEDKDLVYFTIRGLSDEAEGLGRLIGFVRLSAIEWTHGSAGVQLGIGDPDDRGKGYATEALHLLLRYAFTELNLYRLSAFVPGYNRAALGLFQKAGFVEEVRRRGALHREGQRWDMIHMGILRDEWEARFSA